MDKAWAINDSMAQELQSTHEATDWVVNILDAKYEKADLQSIVNTNCSYLSLHNQNKLLELLTKFEELFDGTLGDWKTDPMSFELKESTKPYHGRSYPVTKAYKETTIWELNRMVKLGVVECQPGVEWASPSFIIPKKAEL